MSVNIPHLIVNGITIQPERIVIVVLILVILTTLFVIIKQMILFILLQQISSLRHFFELLGIAMRNSLSTAGLDVRRSNTLFFVLACSNHIDRSILLIDGFPYELLLLLWSLLSDFDLAYSEAFAHIGSWLHLNYPN